jgi:hypothetical protein
LRASRTGFYLHGLADEPPGRGADQHLARVCCLLEPRSDVDGIAGDERLTAACDDLAGVDADPNLESEPCDRAADELFDGPPCRSRIVRSSPW